jgi:hypothetical protein
MMQHHPPLRSGAATLSFSSAGEGVQRTMLEVVNEEPLAPKETFRESNPSPPLRIMSAVTSLRGHLFTNT